MSNPAPRILLGSALIAALHVPLLAYALWLYPQVPAGQSITTLPLVDVLVLLILAVLPYGVLGRVLSGWNPERARIGEYHR